MTTEPDEIRVIAPTCVAGLRIRESSFEGALALKPYLINAGSGATAMATMLNNARCCRIKISNKSNT
jgi:hypothetical protein